jgi:hypothetical protein
MDELETIQSVRSLEQDVLRDVKKINSILTILQVRCLVSPWLAR